MKAEISGYPPKNVYCRTYMQNQLSFVAKLLIMSAFLSALIKYAGPLWPLPATDINALILVLSPSIIMAITLLWRFQIQKQN